MRNNNPKKPNLTSAIDAEGNWKHVNEVASGLACNCYCPHCRSRLIAINSKPEGESKAHHFAHERGSDCIWSDESSLHKLAKEVLAEEKKIMLPILHGETKAKQLEFDRVEQEARDPVTGLIPDCVCYYGEQKLWVEFKRTHEVDTKKADKIRDAKIDCIEIDINVCEINKDAVRQFLVEESGNRVWVYNSKTQQTKIWKKLVVRKDAYYSVHNYIQIDRHIAYDEKANLVNLNNIAPGYDIFTHRYYCIHCGKEVKYVNDHFEHIEENGSCTDDIYLHKAAREVIYNSFNNNKKYEISVPMHHFCKNISNCIFADRSRCFSRICNTFDLKSVGYKICEKAAKIPGHNEVYDIAFRMTQSLEDAIIVNLSTEDCERDLDTSFRQVDIHITDESDIMRLTEGLTIGSYRNFREESPIQVLPEEIQAQVLKFSLYRSGKAFIGHVPCTTCNMPRNGEVIQEYLFLGDIHSKNSIRLLSLLSCYEKQHIGCYCEICAYLKHYQLYPPICKRYKTQGTPKNPLDSKPCQCKAFRLNIELADELRKECKDIKLLEPDYKMGLLALYSEIL